MIKFIRETGEVFDGTPPYIHWLNDQQSTNINYTGKLFIISTSAGVTAHMDENDVFSLIDLDKLTTATKLEDIKTSTYHYAPGTEYMNFYIYQFLFVASSSVPGQFTQTLTLTEDGSNEITSIMVGGDFYEIDESLQINLSNRGLELPVSIQKAFPETNISDETIDSILVNRKFKELISNFLNVIDCRGSYISLYNSLKWFEWGDIAKLYEVWKSDGGEFLEKDLELILNDSYSNLLQSHSKTTHLALSIAINEMTNDLDDEKNPVLKDALEDIGYKWGIDDLMLKVSLLGAFMERYFLPIHLDFKRASAETRVFTTAVKVKAGTLVRRNDWLDDTGVVDIQMDHTVVLGNLSAVAVDKGTVFGILDTEEYTGDQFITPIGVKPLEEVSYPGATGYSNEETSITFSQIVGGVGVIVPISVTIPLPLDDAINTEVLTLYKYDQDGSVKETRQIYERRLWKSSIPNDGGDSVAHFEFNLLSTEEEKVSFTLVLHSLSGHTWSACASYEAIDVRGSRLDICRVKNTDNTIENPVYQDIYDWVNKNPYGAQYNTIRVDNYSGDNIDYSKYHGQTIIQYIPSNDKNQFNRLLVVENNGNVDWITNDIKQDWWVLYRGDDGEYEKTDNDYAYTMLISKKGGEVGIPQISNAIRRDDYIFIPQLHVYNKIEDIQLKKDEYGRYIMSDDDYIVHENDLLSIIPQFKQSVLKHIDPSSIRWIFENKTTLEKIEYDIPISTPIIANNAENILTPGYWTVTMIYSLDGSNEEHKLTKNSAFKLI